MLYIWTLVFEHYVKLLKFSLNKKNFLTLILKPPNITPFICSTANDAASGMSYSMNAKPLCFLRTVSYGRLIDLMGPNGRKACFTVSSWIPKFIEPTYILTSNTTHITLNNGWIVRLEQCFQHNLGYQYIIPLDCVYHANLCLMNSKLEI